MDLLSKRSILIRKHVKVILGYVCYVMATSMERLLTLPLPKRRDHFLQGDHLVTVG